MRNVRFYSGAALGINSSGQIVGEVSSIGSAQAFLYGGQNTIYLGTLGGISSSARGINNNGQVVGYADKAGGIQHAFLLRRWL